MCCDVILLLMRRMIPESPQAELVIYNIVRSEGPINRTDVVSQTGFSKSTVSLQINKLIQQGLIQEKPPEEDLAARRKLRLEVVSDAGYVAGVFLGIHKLSVSLFNLKMEPVNEQSYYIDSVINPEEINRLIAEKLFDILRLAKIDGDQLWGIGLGFPFPVDYAQGVPDSPPNLPFWNRFPLKSFYTERFQCPVVIDNDVNVMALGEGYSGAAQDERDFIFVKVGTGIGAGLFLDGRVYRGAKGSAGDIGHVGIDGESRLCHCGNAGCLETIAAGPAIAARGLQAAMTEESPPLAAILNTKNRITAEDVGNSALQGDMFSIQIIQDSGRNIGTVLAKIVNFANPGMVVIGGGVAKSGNLFLAAVREAIVRRSTHLATIDLSVRFSELGDRCGPTGAARLVIEEIFSPHQFTRTMANRHS